MKENGFTLIELLSVIFILCTVIVIAFESSTFFFRLQKQQSEIAKSTLEEGISLEIMRKDIEMAGFGLPWEMNGKEYEEARSDSNYTPDPSTFNDSPLSPPRAFVLSDNGNIEANSSDVLVIKSSFVAMNDIAKRWGYIDESGTYNPLSPEDSSSGYFVAIDSSRRLIDVNEVSSISPPQTGQIYFLFGIGKKIPRMPFNRVDYFLKRPSEGFPERCCPTTYELYRAVINHEDGKRNPQPILDCVKDFQVSFGLDTDSDGDIDLWTSEIPETASQIRAQVKQVRVFILVQEGSKDISFNFRGYISIGDSDTGELKRFIPDGEEIHYRWKLLKLVVNPINLKPQIR